jgi:hypothetical protein
MAKVYFSVQGSNLASKDVRQIIAPGIYEEQAKDADKFETYKLFRQEAERLKTNEEKELLYKFSNSALPTNTRQPNIQAFKESKQYKVDGIRFDEAKFEYKTRNMLVETHKIDDNKYITYLEYIPEHLDIHYFGPAVVAKYEALKNNDSLDNGQKSAALLDFLLNQTEGINKEAVKKLIDSNPNGLTSAFRDDVKGITLGKGRKADEMKYGIIIEHEEPLKWKHNIEESMPLDFWKHLQKEMAPTYRQAFLNGEETLYVDPVEVDLSQWVDIKQKQEIAPAPAEVASAGSDASDDITNTKALDEYLADKYENYEKGTLDHPIIQKLLFSEGFYLQKTGEKIHEQQFIDKPETEEALASEDIIEVPPLKIPLKTLENIEEDLKSLLEDHLTVEEHFNRSDTKDFNELTPYKDTDGKSLDKGLAIAELILQEKLRSSEAKENLERQHYARESKFKADIVETFNIDKSQLYISNVIEAKGKLRGVKVHEHPVLSRQRMLSSMKFGGSEAVHGKLSNEKIDEFNEIESENLERFWIKFGEFDLGYPLTLTDPPIDSRNYRLNEDGTLREDFEEAVMDALRARIKNDVSYSDEIHEEMLQKLEAHYVQNVKSKVEYVAADGSKEEKSSEEPVVAPAPAAPEPIEQKEKEPANKAEEKPAPAEKKEKDIPVQSNAASAAASEDASVDANGSTVSDNSTSQPSSSNKWSKVSKEVKYGTAIAGGLLTAGAIAAAAKESKKEDKEGEKKKGLSFGTVALCVLGVAITSWALWVKAAPGSDKKLAR